MCVPVTLQHFVGNSIICCLRSLFSLLGVRMCRLSKSNISSCCTCRLPLLQLGDGQMGLRLPKQCNIEGCCAHIHCQGPVSAIKTGPAVALCFELRETAARQGELDRVLTALTLCSHIQSGCQKINVKTLTTLSSPSCWCHLNWPWC